VAMVGAAKAYSPRGYSGLDGVGQALSAALQVELVPLAFTPLGLDSQASHESE